VVEPDLRRAPAQPAANAAYIPRPGRRLAGRTGITASSCARTSRRVAGDFWRRRRRIYYDDSGIVEFQEKSLRVVLRLRRLLLRGDPGRGRRVRAQVGLCRRHTQGSLRPLPARGPRRGSGASARPGATTGTTCRTVLKTCWSGCNSSWASGRGWRTHPGWKAPVRACTNLRRHESGNDMSEGGASDPVETPQKAVPSHLLVANGMELFERLALYGGLSVLMVYFPRPPGIADREGGNALLPSSAA